MVRACRQELVRETDITQRVEYERNSGGSKRTAEAATDTAETGVVTMTTRPHKHLGAADENNIVPIGIVCRSLKINDNLQHQKLLQ